MFSIKTYFVLLVSCLSSISSAFAADFDFTPNLQKAHQEVFKLRLESAKKLAASEKSSNPFRVYVEHYAETIQLLNTDTEDAYNTFLTHEDERLDAIEDLDEQSPYNRFLRAEIKLLSAVVRIRFGNEVKAAWNVIQAAKLLEENQKLFPQFLPTYKSLGCLHIVIGSVPDNHRWVLKLLGLKGNIAQGVSELHRATKDKEWGNEATLTSFFIQEFVLKFDERENTELLNTIENQADNLSFHWLATAISLKSTRNEQALKLLKKAPSDPSYPALSIFTLYRADAHLLKGDYAEASRLYTLYIRQFKGKSYLKEAYYKLALCHWLTGDSTKAQQSLARIPSVGVAYAESDKAAEKFYESYSKTHQLPNKTLLKIKHASDGGYYEKAADLLTQFTEKDLETPKERAEYFFRAGKVFQRTHQNDKALASFEKAIQLSAKESWYFAPSASLQIGYYYQEKGQRQQAKAYFEKAISYKKHEYKSSVDSKARAALTEMGFDS